MEREGVGDGGRERLERGGAVLAGVVTKGGACAVLRQVSLIRESQLLLLT